MIIPGSCVLATSYIQVKFYVKKNLKNSKLLCRMFSCGFIYSYFLVNAKFVFLITPPRRSKSMRRFSPTKNEQQNHKWGFMRFGMGFVRMKHALNPLVFHWFSIGFPLVFHWFSIGFPLDFESKHLGFHKGIV